MNLEPLPSKKPNFTGTSLRQSLVLLHLLYWYLVLYISLNKGVTMACIDKTYTTSWEEYSELKNWVESNNRSFKYEGFRHTEVNLSNCLYSYNENDFSGIPLPVLSTFYMVDRYLIRKCNIKFVQDRMREVYGDKEYDRIKSLYNAGVPNG